MIILLEVCKRKFKICIHVQTIKNRMRKDNFFFECWRINFKQVKNCFIYILMLQLIFLLSSILKSWPFLLIHSSVAVSFFHFFNRPQTFVIQARTTTEAHESACQPSKCQTAKMSKRQSIVSRGFLFSGIFASRMS